MLAQRLMVSVMEISTVFMTCCRQLKQQPDHLRCSFLSLKIITVVPLVTSELAVGLGLLGPLK